MDTSLTRLLTKSLNSVSMSTNSNSLFEKVKARITAAGKEVLAFLSSPVFLKNLVYLLALGILLVFLTFRGLSCYTNHGETLQVHDYTGMTLRDAVSRAEDRSFRVVVSDSIWVPDKAAGIVLDQDPKPLARVKEKRTIYLSITKSDPEDVLLPSLAGSYDYNQYRRKIERKQLKAVVKERVFDNKQAENTILHFFFDGKKITDGDLKDGVRIPKGSTLEFVITERGAGMVELPDLVCMEYTAASFLVSSLGLATGQIISDVTVEDENSAYVYKQVPEYNFGRQIRVGEQVSLYLTQFRPGNCPPELGEESDY